MNVSNMPVACRSGPSEQTGALGDANRDQSRWQRARLLGLAPQRLTHEVNPDRHSGAATLLSFAERTLVIVADPDAGDEVAIEAVEPGVARLRWWVPVLPAISLRLSASPARMPVPRLITSAIMSSMIQTFLQRDHARRDAVHGQQRWRQSWRSVIQISHGVHRVRQINGPTPAVVPVSAVGYGSRARGERGCRYRRR